MIRFSCSRCQMQMQTSPENAGRQTKCPKCQNVVHVPMPTTAVAPPQLSAPNPTQPQTAPSMIPIRCPHCQLQGNVTRENLGTSVTCPQCKKQFQPSEDNPAAIRSAPIPGSAPVPTNPSAIAPQPGTAAKRYATPIAATEDAELSIAKPTQKWKHAIPVLLLTCFLLGTVIRDLVVLSEKPASTATTSTTPEPPRLPPFVPEPGPTIQLQFHERPLDLIYSSTGVKPPSGGAAPQVRKVYHWAPSMRFGLVKLDVQGTEAGGDKGRLTFLRNGWNNNTVIWLDGQGRENRGKGWLFGYQHPKAQDDSIPFPGEEAPGEWLNRSEPLANNPQGRKSVWYYKDEKVRVTQVVEVVEGVQTGRPDTCLVRYELFNDDDKIHEIGLRFLLDTFIGSNDGVPFLIPGEVSQLCSTFRDLRGKEIPDYVEAWEHENPENRGTVARIQFRLSGGIEPPSRVTLGAYPQTILIDQDKRAEHEERIRKILNSAKERQFALLEAQKLRLCQQDQTRWEVPVLPMKLIRHRGDQGDSAVVLYWDPLALKPGEKRLVGFSYGLGDVTGKGQLVLSLGGSFKAGDTFTVTAYVRSPGRDETVTLRMPSGFDLIQGTATQTVPPVPNVNSPMSPVTWRVRAPKQAGRYQLSAELGSGTKETQTIRLTDEGIENNTKSIFD